MQIKTKIVSCHTGDYKPVKQEVNGTVILPPLIFLALAKANKTFIVLASLTIIASDHQNIFIVQATRASL